MITLAATRGLVLGLATGDLRGAPHEGTLPGQVRDHRSDQRPDRARLPGLHTDDTQQAWALAETLLATGGVDPADFGARLAAMVQPRPGLPRGWQRGTGRNFRAAAGALAAGIPWEQAGVVAATNGAAMRVAVVAVGARSLEECVQRALAAGAVTHRSALALEPAAALAALAWALLARPAPPRAEWMGIAREGATLAAGLLEKGGAFADLLGRLVDEGLTGLVALPRIAELARPLRRIAAELTPERDRELAAVATDSFAPASVAAAIALAAGTPDYGAAIEASIAAGYDTDTVAAMAGALAGAAAGIDAVPQEWRADLLAQSALELVARALAGEPGRPPAQAPLEEEWSRAEAEFLARRS